MHYGKHDVPLRTVLSLVSSAVAASGIWRMCEAQTDCLSLSPLQWSQPHFCPSSLWSPPGPGCLRQHTRWLAACGHGGHTAVSLPKQLICIFKQQLPTQQNKMLQPLKSGSWMFLCPAMLFAVLQASCDSFVNACILPLASAGLPSQKYLPNILSDIAICFEEQWGSREGGRFFFFLN